MLSEGSTTLMISNSRRKSLLICSVLHWQKLLFARTSIILGGARQAPGAEHQRQSNPKKFPSSRFFTAV
jgi:hypothetical protein